MADFWQIQGEAGKLLNATIRDASVIGASGCRMNWRTLDTSTFSWSVMLNYALGLSPGDLIPEQLQQVTIWRGGVRYFTGTCTVVEAGDESVDIVISDFWWWLNQIPLTQAQLDSVGASSDRLTFAFPTQELKTSLDSLLDRCIALGAPLGKGTLADMFPCPEINLNQSHLGPAIAELIRLTPDLLYWADHSGAGYPTFNTVRRASAPVRTFAAADLKPGWRVRPVETLKVDFVRIPFVKRGTDGRRVHGEQHSGHSGTAQAGSTTTTIKLAAGAAAFDDAYNGLDITILSGTGASQTRAITDYDGATRVATITPAWTTTPNNTSVYQAGAGSGTVGRQQVLVVSGEELDTFLPNDYFDSVQLKTVKAVPVSGPENTAFNNLLKEKSSLLAGILANYGTIGDGAGTGMTWWTGFSSGPKTQQTRTYPGITYVGENGQVISGTGKNIIAVGTIPDWLAGTVNGVEATLTCTWVATLLGSNGSGSIPYTGWFAELAAQSIDPDGGSGGYANATTTGGTNNQWKKWAAVSISIPVVLTTSSYPALTTVYRPADYDFIQPPAGFAKGLQQSMAFTPYEGTFAIEEAEAGATRYLGTVVNITGHAVADLATMKAMVASVDIDIDLGTTSITLGSAPRLDYKEFLDRIRRTPQNNIKYL